MKMEIAVAASYFWPATVIQKLIMIPLLGILIHCGGKITAWSTTVWKASGQIRVVKSWTAAQRIQFSNDKAAEESK